jgi:hypothetical protein
MHLYEGNADCGERVPQCDTGMRKGGRIDKDEIHADETRLVYAFDEFRLGVALKAVELDAGGGRLGFESGVDIF